MRACRFRTLGDGEAPPSLPDGELPPPLCRRGSTWTAVLSALLSLTAAAIFGGLLSSWRHDRLTARPPPLPTPRSPRPLLFIHNQKTGGDSIMVSMPGLGPRGLENVTDACRRVPTVRRAKEQSKHAQAFVARLAYPDDVWAGAFKVAFVRNPFARAVSWWSMWAEAQQGLGWGVEELLAGCGCAPHDCTFDRFLRHCSYAWSEASAHGDSALAALQSANGGRGLKGVAVPQLAYVAERGADAGASSARLIVDFVGRTESFAHDFSAALRAAGNAADVAAACAASLPHLTHGTTHADYRSYYDASRRAFAASLFATDLAAFNYSFAAYGDSRYVGEADRRRKWRT